MNRAAAAAEVSLFPVKGSSCVVGPSAHLVHTSINPRQHYSVISGIVMNASELLKTER